MTNFSSGSASGYDSIDLDVSGLEVCGMDIDIVLSGAMST